MLFFFVVGRVFVIGERIGACPGSGDLVALARAGEHLDITGCDYRLENQ